MNEAPQRLELTPDQSKLLIKAAGIRISKVSSNKATCHCPYHKDKTPSFNVHLGKGIYKCFSCKRSGTLPQLVYDLTGKGARYYLGDLKSPARAFSYQEGSTEAFTRLASMYYDEVSPTSKLEAYKNAAPPILSGHVVPWHQSNDVKNWMERRGIREKVANDWEFQYAMRTDIIGQYKEDPDDDESRFTSYKRVIIPLYGPDGNLLSYEARITGKGSPKSLYVRPMDFLFRFPFLDKSKPLYLCEGLVDAARLYPFRNNVTYLFGSALSDLKIHLLRKFPKVIIIPDNDAPGFRLVRSFIDSKLNIRVKKIPKEFEDLGQIEMREDDIKYWLRNTPPAEYTRERADVMIQMFDEEEQRINVS